MQKVFCAKCPVFQTIYQTMQILKFSNMTLFFFFDNSSDDELTKMAQAADRMKRTRDGNIFSMIPFHN